MLNWLVKYALVEYGVTWSSSSHHHKEADHSNNYCCSSTCNEVCLIHGWLFLNRFNIRSNFLFFYSHISILEQHLVWLSFNWFGFWLLFPCNYLSFYWFVLFYNCNRLCWLFGFFLTWFNLSLCFFKLYFFHFLFCFFGVFRIFWLSIVQDDHSLLLWCAVDRS